MVFYWILVGSVNVQSQRVAVLSGVDHNSTLPLRPKDLQALALQRNQGQRSTVPDEAKLDRQLKIRLAFSARLIFEKAAVLPYISGVAHCLFNVYLTGNCISTWCSQGWARGILQHRVLTQLSKRRRGDHLSGNGNAFSSFVRGLVRGTLLLSPAI